VNTASAGQPRSAAGTCGCLAPPRWRCGLCQAPWLGCCFDCLQGHLRRRHPEQPPDRPLLEQIRQRQVALNGDNAGNRDSFRSHRERLTRLLCSVQRAEGLCVLGAGNGDDLDLPLLAREFQELHLVDLDAGALEGAADRLPETTRTRMHLHGGVDLSGLLGSIETWGDGHDQLIGVGTAGIATALAGQLGRTFDVVVSTAVLSQLCVPLYGWLARQADEWRALMALVGAIHLQTMAALLRPGGTGVLIGDVLHGRRAPGATAPPPPDWQALPEAVSQRLSEGVARLRNPAYLLELLQQPPLPDLLEDVRVTDPWLWSVDQADMLAYAIIFRRR
jgi:hypothetical protein